MPETPAVRTTSFISTARSSRIPGRAEFSAKFGAYDYPGIIRALSKNGTRMISEVRPKDTDPSAYADKVVAQVHSQLRAGLPASRITIVGASKGSVIAMLVSTRLKNPRVRYVLLQTATTG